jgi:hypothetical protein
MPKNDHLCPPSSALQQRFVALDAVALRHIEPLTDNIVQPGSMPVHQSHAHPAQLKPVYPFAFTDKGPIPVAARHLHRGNIRQRFQDGWDAHISRVKDAVYFSRLQPRDEPRMDLACPVGNMCVCDNACAEDWDGRIYAKSSFNSPLTCCESRKWIACIPTARAPSTFSMKSSTKTAVSASTPNRSSISR